MMLQLVAAVIAAIPSAGALPNYKVPKLLLADDGCLMPERYEVEQFQIWIPAAGNNRSVDLDFAYWDNSTSLKTLCHLNGTSANVALPGLAARYSCENPAVQFIWQNTTLRMIETACPQSNTSSKYEASGSIKPTLTCIETSSNSAVGQGKDCYTAQAVLKANFTSLQPAPRQG